MIRATPKYVYLLECGNLSKIGIASNPRRRIGELTNPHDGGNKRRPPKIVVGVWQCAEPRKMEAMVKARFKRVRYWGYEWFSAKAADVLPAVRLAARVYAATLTDVAVNFGPVGRPAIFTDSKAQDLQDLLNGGSNIRSAAKEMKLSRSGLYKHFNISKSARGKYTVTRKQK